MISYGYNIMIIVDSCMILFHFDCIMQLKKSDHIAINVCSRKSAITFGDLPDCWTTMSSAMFGTRFCDRSVESFFPLQLTPKQSTVRPWLFTRNCENESRFRNTGWHPQKETFSALLAFCVVNSPHNG